jgi:hypothetical protein
MPKYLILKHYRGGPEPHHPFPPMDQWAPEDVEAHMAFQRHVRELLGERHRWHAACARLHELGGDRPSAGAAYAEAARRATDVAERDHLIRQATRARA